MLHVAKDAALACDIFILELNIARIRRTESREDVKEGGLSYTAGAYQGYKLAFFKGEVDIFYGGNIVVGLGYGVYF